MNSTTPFRTRLGRLSRSAWRSESIPGRDGGRDKIVKRLTFIRERLADGPQQQQEEEGEEEEEEEGEQRSFDPYDPGTPEPLSPIEELDDEVQSVRPAWGRRDSGSSSSLRDEPPKTTGTVDSGHASVDGSTGGPPSLEHCTDLLFSRQHLLAIFADRELALKFTTFLRTHRPSSVPILAYYLDAIKALKTIRYADSIIRGLGPISGHAFTTETNSATMAWVMEDKADRALDVLVKDDLPAFIAYTYVRTVDLALVDRVTGKQDATSRTIAEGLAEVFVLSDPSRPDNPIVFTSEEFHTMTGWSRKEILGRNCRLLGGTKTSPFGIRRFRASLDAEREHCEVLLNYHQDGSPFINLIMCVPLRDKTNRVRYYLGAQLDITGLVNSYTGLRSLCKVAQQGDKRASRTTNSDVVSEISLVDEFTEFSETLSPQELEKLVTLSKRQQEGFADSSQDTAMVPEPFSSKEEELHAGGAAPALGFYQNYLLVRPYPSLRILFASPGLRNSGILQQPLLKSIGGSSRVRQDLTHALEMGRKVTAKVKWISTQTESHTRWIHCTPLLGVNDTVGVWMVILVDAELEEDVRKEREKIEPEVRRNTKNGNYTSDPTPWDTATRRTNNASGVTTAIWGEGGFWDQKDDEAVQIDPKRFGRGPVPQKTGLGPIPGIGDRKFSHGSKNERQAAVEDEFSIGEKTGKQGSFDNNPSSHGDERPPSSSTGSSSRVPIQTQLRPTIRIAGRPSFEAPKPAPINLPGPPRPTAADDPDGLRSVRKRTYKSLSPYGILFDG